MRENTMEKTTDKTIITVVGKDTVCGCYTYGTSYLCYLCFRHSSDSA